MTETKQIRFKIGQLVHHKLFDYRGVIFDVAPDFQGTEEWYNQMAKSKPPKDKPWYRVIVHNATHETYVAEQNLEPDMTGEAINHPAINHVFSSLSDGVYEVKQKH